MKRTDTQIQTQPNAFRTAILLPGTNEIIFPLSGGADGNINPDVDPTIDNVAHSNLNDC
ncbi:hypothetical protein K435DRAFT_773771 [Dendrothele bispora CBS 962.96]|uniref:Uncharacterized protein n=1 Tax=Dendrothele bispora (strain CBS 962.96) TaxID=1314807 RepID=A0A4S8MRC4_DENBC|nr:hypothetical protein K435DRAFT_773771 [Dendrothele bispora CBS 962.96]